jgi:hypothetical protein
MRLRPCLVAVLVLLVPGAASADSIAWEAVFDDGFESGDLSGWDAVNNPGGDLAVTAGAALTGGFGLQATVNDTAGLYVQDNSPADDGHYRASFRFDPHTFDPGEAQAHFRTRIFIGFEEGPRRLFAVVLRRIGGQYALMGRARRDDNSQANTGFVPISAAVHTIHVYWKRSSGPDASDGIFEMSVDGVPSTLAGLDNSVSSVDFARLGALSVKAGAGGILYWDEFASFRNQAARALVCETPADGADVDLTPGNGVVVAGTALGLTGVRVNGAPVTLAPDRSFTASVTGRYGLNVVELSGLSGGATHTGLCAFVGSPTWLAEGDRNLDAVGFRLEPTGYQKLETRVPPWFASSAFTQGLHNGFLAAASPLEQGGSPSSFSYRITYQSLSAHIDAISASVLPGNQTINFHVQMDLTVRLRVQGSMSLIPYNSLGDVVFSNMSFDVHVNFGVNPTTQRIVVTGDIPGTYNPGQITHTFTTPPPLPALITSWAPDGLWDIVVPTLAPVATAGAGGLYTGLFDDMTTTMTGTGFPVGRLDGGGSVTLALGVTGGAVQLAHDGLDLMVGLSVTNPPPPPTGAGRIPMPPPYGVFEGSTSTDARAIVYAGLFNQVFHALWRAGAFDGTVAGDAIDPALPNGTSMDVMLRAMPVLTAFETETSAGLDIGAFDLVVTHPDLPPSLHVRAAARVHAGLSLAGDDLVFGDLAVTELHVATGDVVLAAPARATLEDLVRKLVLKAAALAANDGLPALPQVDFTVPASLQTYGFTPGTHCRAQNPVLQATLPTTSYLFLAGGFFP